MACLTDSQIRTTQPREKIYKLVDGGSLSVWILPSGAKSFRFKYRFKRRNDSGELGTKEDSYTIGRYPKVSLKQARRERDPLHSYRVKFFEPVRGRGRVLLPSHLHSSWIISVPLLMGCSAHVCCARGIVYFYWQSIAVGGQLIDPTLFVAASLTSA
jgi:hypothetical protein